MLLVWDQKWRLHIQPVEIKHPDVGDAKHNLRYTLKGNQTIHDLIID